MLIIGLSGYSLLRCGYRRDSVAIDLSEQIADGKIDNRLVICRRFEVHPTYIGNEESCAYWKSCTSVFDVKLGEAERIRTKL